MAEESLIPKKLPTAVSYPAAGAGIFLRIAFIIFLVSALITGALFLYRNFLKNSLSSAKEDLRKLEIEFEPATILKLEAVSDSIVASRELLRNHVKPSAIFDLIEANTLETVSFGVFSYNSDKNTVTLIGEAASYSDVSAQSSVFETLSDVASATFSNLALREAGTVGFTLNIALK